AAVLALAPDGALLGQHPAAPPAPARLRRAGPPGRPARGGRCRSRLGQDRRPVLISHGPDGRRRDRQFRRNTRKRPAVVPTRRPDRVRPGPGTSVSAVPDVRYAYLEGPTPLARAHRGGAVAHLESTMPAFEASVAM